MKLIPLTDRGQMKARDVVRQIAQVPPAGQSLNFDEMNKRCRILEALDSQKGDTLRLEDADWQVLKQAVNSFPFGIASIELRDIVQGIIDAEDAIHAVKKEKA